MCLFNGRPRRLVLYFWKLLLDLEISSFKTPFQRIVLVMGKKNFMHHALFQFKYNKQIFAIIFMYTAFTWMSHWYVFDKIFLKLVQSSWTTKFGWVAQSHKYLIIPEKLYLIGDTLSFLQLNIRYASVKHISVVRKFKN